MCLWAIQYHSFLIFNMSTDVCCFTLLIKKMLPGQVNNGVTFAMFAIISYIIK